MTQTTHSISSLRQRMIDYMNMRKLAPKTHDGYIRGVKNLTRFLGNSPDTATAEDLRRYQLHMVDSGISRITLNANITALKFFFDVTLDHRNVMKKMSYVPVPRKLPVILNRDEVARVIGAADKLKYKAALAIANGAGLRVSEVVALKIGDIDSTRMTLRVEQGKGRKDRYLFCSIYTVPGGAKAMLKASCWMEAGCFRGRTRLTRCVLDSSVVPVIRWPSILGLISVCRCIL